MFCNPWICLDDAAIGVLTGSVAAATVCFLIQSRISRSLNVRNVSPGGVVALQLSGTTRRAERMIEAWGPQGVARARLNLSIDFGLIVAYSTALCVIWGWVASTTGARWILLWSYAQLVAGAADVVENVGLWRMISGDVTEPRARNVLRLATLKFVLVGLAPLGAAFVVWKRSQLSALDPPADRSV